MVIDDVLMMFNDFLSKSADSSATSFSPKKFLQDFPIPSSARCFSLKLPQALLSTASEGRRGRRVFLEAPLGRGQFHPTHVPATLSPVLDGEGPDPSARTSQRLKTDGVFGMIGQQEGMKS